MTPKGVRYALLASCLGSALGCATRATTPATEPPPARPSFGASRVRSFSDSLPVTAIADSANALYVGTARGLVRWDLGLGRYSTMSQRDGLPADRVTALAVAGDDTVWVATGRGLSRGRNGAWQNFAVAPVGEIVGLVATRDGVWAGGPAGLARLRNGRWDHYLADVPVTALGAGARDAVWIGTRGRGLLRLGGNGDTLEAFAAAQGCALDEVQALVAVGDGVLALGSGAGATRVALHDGQRFHDYAVVTPQPLTWVARNGARVYLGGGNRLYELGDAGSAEAASEAARLVPLDRAVSPPLSLALAAELRLPATAANGVAAPAQATTSAPARARASGSTAANSPPPSPRLVLGAVAPLATDVTAAGSSSRGLLLGTRHQGVVRLENGVPRGLRMDDLCAGAARLTVACVGERRPDECYVATGGTRAWRFDGESFTAAAVDPEPGARVLAVVRDPHGGVLAIHRGAADRELRLSRVDAGRWTPIGVESVEVPHGAPDLNFAGFSPDGHLWIGLRYTDREGDARDYGAAEIAVDDGGVVVHRQGGGGEHGFLVPSDVVAMYWRAPNEAWFATRGGAVRVRDGEPRLFTENDGLESENVRDIGRGDRGDVWVATSRGTGRFDGQRWSFPRLGAFYLPASALADDTFGHFFIGTERGLYCLGDCAPEPIDRGRGLIDDAVLDLAVDPRNRVWILTAHGISIAEP